MSKKVPEISDEDEKLRVVSAFEPENTKRLEQRGHETVLLMFSSERILNFFVSVREFWVFWALTVNV